MEQILSISKLILSYLLLCTITAYSLCGQDIRIGIQSGHSQHGINAILSTDAQFLLSIGASDNTAIIWDAKSGRELNRFYNSNGWTGEAAIQPKTNVIALGSRDSTVHIIDFSTSKEIAILRDTIGMASHLFFSESGEYLLTVHGLKITVWNTNGFNIEEKHFAEKAIRAIGLFPKKNKLRYIIEGGIVEWSWQEDQTLRRGSDLIKFQDENNKLYSISLNTDLNILAVVRTQDIAFYDLEYLKLIKNIDQASGDVWQDHILTISFRPNSTEFLARKPYDGILVGDIGTDSLRKMTKSVDLLSPFYNKSGDIIVKDSGNSLELIDANEFSIRQVLKKNTSGLWGPIHIIGDQILLHVGPVVAGFDYETGHLATVIETPGIEHKLKDHSMSNNLFITTRDSWGYDTLGFKKERIDLWDSQNFTLSDSIIGKFISLSPNKNLLLYQTANKVSIYDLNKKENIYTYNNEFSENPIACFISDSEISILSNDEIYFYNFVEKTSSQHRHYLTDCMLFNLRLVPHKLGLLYEKSKMESFDVIFPCDTLEYRAWNVLYSNQDTSRIIQNLLYFKYNDEVKSVVKSTLFSLDDDTIVKNYPFYFFMSDARLGTAQIAKTRSSLGGMTASKMDEAPIESVVLFNYQDGKMIPLPNMQRHIHSSFYNSPDNKRIIALNEDGLDILKDTSGNVLISFKYFDNDPEKWVHLHPDGFFDASPEAMKLMYWVKGTEIIEFEQLKNRYWIPGLWKKVMEGAPLPDARGMNELKLPPTIDLEFRDSQLAVHLKKRDGGYGPIQLMINGKEYIEDARDIYSIDTTLNEQTFFVDVAEHPYLTDGENTFSARSTTADGFVKSQEVSISMGLEPILDREPQFFGVCIGVDQYANENINLRFSGTDATSIAKAIEIGASNLFGKDRTFVYNITSTSAIPATKAGIASVFTEIKDKATSRDIIMIYLAGHGLSMSGEENGEFYFLTADAIAADRNAYIDPVLRKQHSISTAEWVEWLKEILALKQVMIIDACGAGQAIDNLIASRDIDPSQIKAIDRMRDRTGMFVLSGCAADAPSYEATRFGQGLLTYSVLEAIKGAALKEEKFVDISTVFNYARDRVPELARQIGGIQKPQMINARTGSFDIGVLSLEDRADIPLARQKPIFTRSTFLNLESLEDDLALSTTLDETFKSISTRGDKADLIYFDVKEFPEACRITGSYSHEDKIELRMKLRCGETAFERNFSGESTVELVNKILEEIDILLNSMPLK